MRSYKIVSCIMIALFFYSCSYKLTFGDYSLKKSPHSLSIHADSIFEYHFNGDCCKSSSGTWIEDEAFVYLNSNCKVDRLPLESQISDGDSVDYIGRRVSVVSVHINAPYECRKDYICFPIVNGELSFEYPERGSFSFGSIVPIDSIYFLVAKIPRIVDKKRVQHSFFNDLKTEKINSNLPIGDNLNITVHIIDSLFSYQVFNNKKIKKRNGKLLFKDDERKYKLRIRK